jgi:heme exporter protein B
MLVTETPASLLAAAKALGHWLTTGLPLLIAAGPLAIMLQLKPEALPALLLGLALGTATLSLVGTACAAIVLGARRGAVLLPVLILPLATPVLIFGTAAADAAATGLSIKPHLLLLAAFLAASLPLCPLAAGAALRGAAD